MTTEELARFRRRIGDQPKGDTDRITLAADDNLVELRFSNVYDVLVYADDELQDENTYTVDAVPGIITFDTTQTAGTELRFQYKHVAYSDDELTDLAETYGTDGAVVEVLNELLVDAARLYDYSQGATDAKLSQVFDHLEKLLNRATGIASGGNGISMARRINPLYERRNGRPRDISRGY